MDEPNTPSESSPIIEEDPATMDLDAKVGQAWTDFQTALAEALSALPETVGAIEITLDPSAAGHGMAVYSVSVDLTDPDQLRAYAVSNRMLPTEHLLPMKRLADIMAMGWQPPEVVPNSGERFGLALARSAVVPFAKIITRTLREAYGSPHPAFLLYTAADREGSAFTDPPALGVARPVGEGGVDQLDFVDLNALPLSQRVALALSAMLNVAPESLPVDADGDIGIRSGSAMVFVRVRDEPPLVQVFSPVLTEVKEHHRLYQKLSDLVHRMPIGRLYYEPQSSAIFAGITVMGRDFQASHLMLALEVMTRLADELDDKLRREFGGRRFFGDPDESPDPEPPPSIGLYM